MSEPAPRFTLPDEWSKGRCPACAAPKLQIQHSPDNPDQVYCQQCGFACEVSESGSHIRPIKLPPHLAPVQQLAARQWLAIPELRTLARPATAPQADASAPPASSEMIARAKTLYSLGNSLKQIESSLINSGAPPEQIAAVMAEVSRIDKEKRERSNRSLTIMGGSAAAVLLILCAVGGLLAARPDLLPPTPTLPPTAVNSNSNVIPAPILTVLPPGVLPENIVVPPTPSTVEGSGPPPSDCPISTQQAAALFGGQASYWMRDTQTNGWTMIAAGLPVTVFVPANMTAGYLTIGDSLSMLSVTGPATINNANFVAIACQ